MRCATRQDNLADAGLEFDGYSKDGFVRRPKSGVPGP